VLTARGERVTPILFGVLDDRSRLACHLQWYLTETAEVIGRPRFWNAWLSPWARRCDSCVTQPLIAP
jgi:hypothetical protein